MAKSRKFLFITQAITPYVDESEISLLGRRIPQMMQEKGREIRTFMPKWGTINERRLQLHEVIRLSGMNLIIDDTDHLLIIKVASIPSARMQVYFIDNDDYFMKRLERCDASGKEYEDNGERSIFYARGVLETVKKLRWVPDVIHCQGWMSAMAPLYIKTCYHDEPSFRDSKIIFTPNGNELTLPTTSHFLDSILVKGMKPEVLKDLPDALTIKDLYRLAIKYSDALLLSESGIDDDLRQYAEERGIPIMEAHDINGEDASATYLSFFDQISGANPEEEED